MAIMSSKNGQNRCQSRVRRNWRCHIDDVPPKVAIVTPSAMRSHILSRQKYLPRPWHHSFSSSPAAEGISVRLLLLLKSIYNIWCEQRMRLDRVVSKEAGAARIANFASATQVLAPPCET